MMKDEGDDPNQHESDLGGRWPRGPLNRTNAVSSCFKSAQRSHRLLLSVRASGILPFDGVYSVRRWDLQVRGLRRLSV